MKPFDDQFADNVRETFDAWDEPVDEQGWQQMKARLEPSARKRLFLLPLWVKMAAAFFGMGVMGFSFWLLLNFTANDRPMAESFGLPDNLGQSYIQPAEDTIETDHVTPDVSAFITAPSMASVDRGSALPAQNGQPSQPGDESFGAIPQEAAQPHEVIAGMPLVDSLLQQPELADIPPAEQPADERTISSQDTLKQFLTDEQIIRENLAVMSLEDATDSQNAYVEVSAGTLKTWSGTEIMGGAGVSAGLAGQWPLGQRFSLSSGGSLIYNQFSIAEGGSLITGRLYGNMASLPNFEDAHQVEVLDRQSSTDFAFMALDIPFNVRYKLYQVNRSSLYVSAGISSLIYLQQRYQTQTNILAEVSGVGTQGEQFFNTNSFSTVQSNDFGVFSRVDFARFLNFSAGYVIMGRTQSLAIEPYVKYPLGGITSLNFQIGMAGISLKYRPAFR